MELKEIVNDARRFIEIDSKKNTAEFNVSEEQYNELRNSDLLAGGYKILKAHLRVKPSYERSEPNNKTVDVTLGKADYNWLTGGFL